MPSRRKKNSVAHQKFEMTEERREGLTILQDRPRKALKLRESLQATLIVHWWAFENTCTPRIPSGESTEDRLEWLHGVWIEDDGEVVVDFFRSYRVPLTSIDLPPQAAEYIDEAIDSAIRGSGVAKNN